MEGIVTDKNGCGRTCTVLKRHATFGDDENVVDEQIRFVRRGRDCAFAEGLDVEESNSRGHAFPYAIHT